MRPEYSFGSPHFHVSVKWPRLFGKGAFPWKLLPQESVTLTATPPMTYSLAVSSYQLNEGSPISHLLGLVHGLGIVSKADDLVLQMRQLNTFSMTNQFIQKYKYIWSTTRVNIQGEEMYN